MLNKGVSSVLIHFNRLLIAQEIKYLETQGEENAIINGMVNLVQFKEIPKKASGLKEENKLFIYN